MDDLIGRCVRGEADAWDAFVEQYASVIYGAVRRVVFARVENDPSIGIEDIAQEVFARLLRRDAHLLRSYDPSRASLVTWLTIIARSTALDIIRKKRPKLVPLEPNLEASGVGSPWNASPPMEDIPAELLSPRQALVMHLLFDRGLDVAEAAGILGVQDQTVRSAKHKAIKKLREHLSGGEANK